MKLTFLTFIIPFAAASSVMAAAKVETLVSCQLKDLAACTDCQKRIPASCEDHAFDGSLDASVKPKKIQWLVSNSESGTEKIISTENKSLSLKDLQTSKDLKSVATKQKVAVRSGEKVALLGVQVAASTALYKSQQGTEIAAQMKPQTNQRSVASAPSPIAGGVKRAQKIQSKSQSQSKSQVKKKEEKQ